MIGRASVVHIPTLVAYLIAFPFDHRAIAVWCITTEILLVFVIVKLLGVL
jgi:hypothetical protein